MTHYPSHSKIYHIKSDSLALDNSKINKVKPLANKMPENSNPLSGLLGQYDSDSDHENVNGQESLKLDAKVDNFLQEINQIAPNTTNNTQANQQIAWQECFDESTGYPYYWNVETNAVTWEMPPEYKQWLTKTQTSTTTTTTTTKSNEKVVPVVIKAVDTENTNNKMGQITNKQQQIKRKHKQKTVNKNKKSFDSGSSDEEKIVMITSFSEESSSESENETNQKENPVEEKKIENSPPNKIIMGPYIEDIPKQPDPVIPETNPKKEIIENVKDENIDETVILARLRTQAKVLHELGGELPKFVDKAILADKLENKPQSLCLVAGYGDDSDHSEAEDETLFKKTIFPIPEIKDSGNNEAKQTESTLFPVTVPIDVKQFEITENTKPATVEAKDPSEELIDNKAFKRKKRLGLTFDVKKTKIEDSDDLLLMGESRKGFGFQASNENNGAGVKKTGIAFIKADVLNSNESSNHSDIEDFSEIKSIVTEKVNFLGEGKDPVSAVQTMLIQLQTLEAAYNVQALTKAYLYSWLRETSTGLEKLEQEAAPEGWTCQWDRSHKRYFYRNTATGETQWHYPDVEPADIVGGGEAMDICTTPPPNEDLPQRTRTRTPSPTSPAPSSPASITTTTNTNNDVQPPIPTAPPPDETIPPPPPTISETNQPLPPGVETSDLPYFAAKLKELSSQNKNETNRDSLGSELDSFYSDIAQLEATSSQGSIPEIQETKSVSSPSSVGVGENPADLIVKKKKKSKKIGQGINMKKKAVSSLVEKWKKVQNDY